ncbi:glycoside hydrolase family 13 protein [Pseudoflavonifractor sp. MSJ-37]|nr:glycoside hydrolase family 13 protein [Pseudoflavonifractor sp. MSJ-37]
MTDPLAFDPRDGVSQCPYGAVPSGTRVRFTVRPRRAEGFSRLILSARFEGRGDAVVERSFPWTGVDGAWDRFQAELDTGDYVGLVWYAFRLEGIDGRSRTLGDYQLTVYDDQEAVPGWFGDGLTYQIFPDRFRRLSVPDPAGMVGGRQVHQSWDEEPVYRPDAHGEIRNRDFFGGSLAGVREKLPYLHALGVETIYFCPIFEGAENHRYGTGDYEQIDPMLGDEAEFRALCREAHGLGMRVMLDGVFNHSGYVSRYFNGDRSYPSAVPGAAQSTDSPFYPWYHFQHWPDRYDSWWGIYSLPAVNESEPSYLDYIIRGENSIVKRWLRAGADGWRLDVADELPDSFVHALHTAARSAKADAVVIGEVWEDGSNKIAYGVRRKHLLGGHCDGLMNYPFRGAALDYLLGGDAAAFRDAMEALRANYPPFAWHSAMNALGTHDTPRILTLLGMGSPCLDQSRDWRAAARLAPDRYAPARERLMAGLLLLYAFPGSPTLYYGDEAGMEGFEDPFNRRTYPWGREDPVLRRWTARLGRLRRTCAPLRRGDIVYEKAEGPLLAFWRTLGNRRVLAAVNAGDAPVDLPIPGPMTDRMTGELFPISGSRRMSVPLPPRTGRLLLPLPLRI